MTYRQDEVIEAVDYNSFRTTLLDVWDVGNGMLGYGQIDTGGASAIPTVAVGADVLSTEWEALRFAAQTASDHQGSTTTFPPASELLVDEVIEAHEADDGNIYDFDGSLATITTNSLLFDAGSVSVFSNELVSTRGSSWSVQLEHRFTAIHPTVDDARYFFNSGGEIRFRGSRSGGSSNDQNTSWTDILTNMGTIIFNYTETTGGGSGWTMSTIGYYDLTTSWQRIATGIDPAGGAYASNEATIDARVLDGPTGPNGDVGRQLEFRVRYTDNHTNGFFDSVNGTIESRIDYQKATSPLTIQDPVFASSIVLTDGS